jgi:hypothetical protein
LERRIPCRRAGAAPAESGVHSRAALAQPDEIDTGGKHFALPGQHHRGGVGAAQRLELRSERRAELDVERVGLAVNHRYDGDAAAPGQLDHFVT